MERSGKEVISGTQTEVYPPLPPSWGNKKESLQTGHAPRVFCQSLAFAHTAYLGSNLQPHQDLWHRVTKHRCDNEVRQFNQKQCRIKPPKSRPAKEKRTPNPKATFPRAPHRALGNPHSLPLTSSSSPRSAPKWLSPRHPPRGWEPVPHQHLENSQPSCPGARLSLPWGEGRQAASPRSALRLRAGRTVMESRQLFSDNQRWEAAPVNSVHPVAAGSVSSSWQQLSQEQWWAQLEIFHN